MTDQKIMIDALRILARDIQSEDLCIAEAADMLEAYSASPNRDGFEAWITRPPFERSVERYPDDPKKYGWPGRYRDTNTALAWEAWQAGHSSRWER